MNAVHFDAIARLFASRKSRRAAIAGGIGLASTAVTHRAFAQDGTPEVATPMAVPTDPHASADDAQPNPEFLFVQPFDAGSWAPKDGEDGVYTLTLTGAAANTVYFSDRPDRIVGLASTDQFLDGLGFTPDNPPNAAIVAQREDGSEQEILVIELLNPSYDADAETLTYDARVLADYGEHGLAHLARQQTDYELNESFGAGGLFIDDCPDARYCGNDGLRSIPIPVCDIPGGPYGRCWSWSSFTCSLCSVSLDDLIDICSNQCGIPRGNVVIM